MYSGPLLLARMLHGLRQSRFPGFVEPSLATLAAHAPRGNDWLHEVKYDGYRLQCHIRRGIRFYTRRDMIGANDCHLCSFMTAFSQHAIIFDGEVVVQTPEGPIRLSCFGKRIES
jgi:bifunctional non-homologous end joining protein LigD